MNYKRVFRLNDIPVKNGRVCYWMSRDQRVHDNWALVYAQEKALEMNAGLSVVFCLVKGFLGAGGMQYSFMLEGLKEVSRELAALNIGFEVLTGEPATALPSYVKKNNVGLLVSDFDPLRIKRSWKFDVSNKISSAFHEVDAHNIVPCRVASGKQEYGAYTIRPKIMRAAVQWLDNFPDIVPHRFNKKISHSGFEKAEKQLKLFQSGSAPDLISGEKNAQKTFKSFLSNGLSSYSGARNDPSLSGQSGLSPFLHFGMISAQRIAKDVLRSRVSGSSKDEFLDELIVRRELSDNYCFYNPAYDRFEGLPEWSRKTLEKHRRDKRTYIYSMAALENAETHDEYWNACQRQMTMTGKMHGYMRMYWAKKILEWTASPEEAFETAVFLNDKYELDGRDPNGYAGIAWSLGGLHDRPWSERPVFGQVRYMSFDGLKRKYDMDKYLTQTGLGKKV